MILGIGVDLLHLPRFNALYKKYPVRLASRILSEVENIQNPPVQYLSTRWVVKEAVYKAFSGSRQLSWKDMSLLKDKNGQPRLEIRDFDGKCLVSITHDGEYAMAMVVVKEWI